jgi:activator of HSP90 ATPase
VFKKVRERLAVSQKAAQTFDVEIFSRSKLSALEVREKYQSKISNTFAALENLNDGERALKNY